MVLGALSCPAASLPRVWMQNVVTRSTFSAGIGSGTVKKNNKVVHAVFGELHVHELKISLRQSFVLLMLFFP